MARTDQSGQPIFLASLLANLASQSRRIGHRALLVG